MNSGVIADMGAAAATKDRARTRRLRRQDEGQALPAVSSHLISWAPGRDDQGEEPGMKAG